MTKVKADLQCPFCGFCKVLTVPDYRKGVSCPSCNQSIFLSWATGVLGELDANGFYFHAHEPFNLKGINAEFREFLEDEKKPLSSFTVRRKLRG